MSFSLSSLIDAVCDEFERAYSAGESPRIEDYMNRAGEEARERTFRELLNVEVELRRSKHELITTADYLSRFPGLESWVIQACGD